MKESANVTLADINRLIEENESMKAEIERLRDMYGRHMADRVEEIERLRATVSGTSCCAAKDAEIERLTAWALEERGKVERLTAALREIVDRTGSNIARAALEGK